MSLRQATPVSATEDIFASQVIFAFNRRGHGTSVVGSEPTQALEAVTRGRRGQIWGCETQVWRWC